MVGSSGQIVSILLEREGGKKFFFDNFWLLFNVAGKSFGLFFFLHRVLARQ